MEPNNEYISSDAIYKLFTSANIVDVNIYTKKENTRDIRKRKKSDQKSI
jgi:hypothetical protein